MREQTVSTLSAVDFGGVLATTSGGCVALQSNPTPFLWGLLCCRSSKVITALARLPQGEVSAQELDPANWVSVQRTCSCGQTLRVHRTLTATPAACPPLGKSLVPCEAAAQESLSSLGRRKERRAHRRLADGRALTLMCSGQTRHSGKPGWLARRSFPSASLRDAEACLHGTVNRLSQGGRKCFMRHLHHHAKQIFPYFYLKFSQ